MIFFLIATTITLSSGIFKDVSSDKWYYSSVISLYQRGVVDGYNDGTFRPDNYVTRAEVATMINSMINYTENKPQVSPIDQFDQHVTDLVAKVTSSVVKIETDTSYGSGFIIDYNGEGNYIATNYHVIENGGNITVSLSNGKSYNATVKSQDTINDLAILHINEGDKLKHLELSSNSNDMRNGSEIIIVSNPLEFDYSTTKGVISNNDRGNLIQTDASVNAGSSGSPMINVRTGKVIAVTVGKVSGAKVDNIGFGVKIDRLEALIDGRIKIQ